MRRSIQCLLGGIVIAAIAPYSVASAFAGGCGDYQEASPATNIPTGIRFYNDSHYAMRIYWAGFDGSLKEYALLQPQEYTGFKTYVHHRWYVEVYSQDEAYCVGPVSAPDTEECEMHIDFDDNGRSVGMNGGYCDY